VSKSEQEAEQALAAVWDDTAPPAEGDGWVGRVRTQYNDCAPRLNMTSADIRQRFLNFFKERDHKVLRAPP